ncbi:MAG: hypothetical protein Q9M89_06800, partial [Persephonella sp.]|nr:hypothetical protein [Persephonella sp.]
MEEGLLKEVQRNLLDIYSFVKNILDEELSSHQARKSRGWVENRCGTGRPYEDWVEKIETAPS